MIYYNEHEVCIMKEIVSKIFMGIFTVVILVFCIVAWEKLIYLTKWKDI